MNITTTFLTALRRTTEFSKQRPPEFLLGQLYKVSLEDTGLLLPLAGGEFRIAEPFCYEWNPFPSYIILYTLEGSGIFSTEDTEQTLDHGHLLFFDCSERFSLKLAQGKWRFQLFFLCGQELSAYYNIFRQNFLPCYPIPVGSCVPARMAQLTRFPFVPSPTEQLQLHEQLSGMFIELARFSLSLAVDTKPIPSYLLAMKVDFDDHYADNHSLEYFKSTLGISRYRLCREFSATFHNSPLQYLQEKKIEAAKKLLLTDDMPIHEVGSAVGIDNTNHFIHLFKKHTGVTPFVYRQNAPQSIRGQHCPSTPDDLPPQ